MKMKTLAIFVAAAALAVSARGETVTAEPDALLDYIEATGSQYIDTGVNAETGLKAIIDFAWADEDLSGVDWSLLDACTASSNSNERSRFFMCHMTNGKPFFGYGKTRKNPAGAVPFVRGERCEIITDMSSTNSLELTQNGVNTFDATDRETFSTNENVNLHHNLFVFATNYGGAPNWYGKGKLYELKIFKKNAETDEFDLLRHYIPCIKDNRAGLYDKVNGTISFSSPDFIAGSVTNTGNCGVDDPDTDGVDESQNVTWSYDVNTKALTISGTGKMMYYGSAQGSDSQYHSTAPWSHFDSEIETVVVENGVTYIGSYAFAYCTALISISLPASVVALGDYVCYTSNILRIDIPATSVVTLGTDGFDYTPAGLVIAVPANLLTNYKTATNWSEYEAKLEGVLSESTGFDTTFATGNYEYSRTFNCGVAATLCLPFELSSTQISPYGKVYTFDGIDKTTEPKWTVVMREEDPSNRVTGNLAANTPYLFVPYILDGKSKGDAMPITFTGEVTTAANASYASWSEGTDGAYWTFQGVYYNVAWDANHADLGKVYGFAAQSYNGGSYNVSPGDFVKAMAGASIAPFRAFLQYTPANGSRTRGADELPAKMSVRLVNHDSSVPTGIEELRIKNLELRDDAWYSLDGRRLGSKPTSKGIYINNGNKVVIK